MRSGPTLISSMFGHEIRGLAARRFHEQHLSVFQNVVTRQENNFAWKLTFINSPTPPRKRAEAAEEKRKILQWVFFALSLVVFTLLYSQRKHVLVI